MKKLILAVVLVFATGSMMSSTIIINDVCWDNAQNAVYFAKDNALSWHGFGGLSFKEEYDVFAKAYDSCLRQWQY
jgi:hypothetical protein